MAEIVNLRRARKNKLRAEKDKTAQASRITHGTPKALRKREEAKTAQARERLSGHRLENEPGDK